MPRRSGSPAAEVQQAHKMAAAERVVPEEAGLTHFRARPLSPNVTSAPPPAVGAAGAGCRCHGSDRGAGLRFAGVRRSCRRAGGSPVSRPDPGTVAATPEAGKQFCVSRRTPPHAPYDPGPAPLRRRPVLRSLQPRLPRPQLLPLASRSGEPPPRGRLLGAPPPPAGPLPESQALISTAPFSRGPAFSRLHPLPAIAPRSSPTDPLK